MSNVTLNLDPALHRYLLDHSLREDDISASLRERTMQLSEHAMLSSPEQVQLLTLLATLAGARRLVEVGTFTGYTALRMALALPEARIVCCDLSEKWTAIGREHWHQAGVEARIELRLGAALDTLDALLAEHGAGSFDFAYIDADKENYLAYFERCLQLLRGGGLLAADNVLWGGRVIDEAANDADTRAIRGFNQALHTDSRVLTSMVPIGDGLTLAVKR